MEICICLCKKSFRYCQREVRLAVVSWGQRRLFVVLVPSYRAPSNVYNFKWKFLNWILIQFWRTDIPLWICLINNFSELHPKIKMNRVEDCKLFPFYSVNCFPFIRRIKNKYKNVLKCTSWIQSATRNYSWFSKQTFYSKSCTQKHGIKKKNTHC